MSLFHGKQRKGVMRAVRARKRRQAEKRNEVTAPERRRAARRAT